MEWKEYIRPYLNMVPNQTVPNMVFATVGDGGKISIYNNAGTTHVVADMLGWFGDGAGSRYVALGLVPVLVGALWVHAGNGWLFTAPNGGWEYPAFLVVVSVAVAMLGDGALALRPATSHGRPNAAPARA